jgi:DNA-binding LacI/PurR family transcriptional regulator
LDIRDLARHLNVSISTISRALSGRSGVGAETRERVLAAAAKFNYSPNQSGRNLRKGRTHAIAFMLQPHPGDHQYGEPIFMPFLKGLQIGLAKHNYELIAVLGDPGDDLDRLRRIVESRWADAIVLAWTQRKDPRIEYLTKVGFPFATFGRSESGGKTYPSIDFDFVRAGRDSIARLSNLGHRRVAIVTPSPKISFAHLFRQGYRDAVKQYGMVADPGLIVTGEVNEQGGYEATLEVMQRKDRPTAIVYNNDAMALGGCRALSDLSLRPGRDVGVIVVVSTAFSRYLSPALTGFAIKLEPVGERLAEMLMQAMPGRAGSERGQILREVWPLELTARESDLPPRTDKDGETRPVPAVKVLHPV